MASEPYLFDRFLGCYKAPRVPQPDPDPHCTVDKYTQSMRDRWALLRQDPCKKLQFTALNDACCDLDCAVKFAEKVCTKPGSWAGGQSLYQKDFKFPKSHNDIDDCCTSPCPCADGLPNYCRDSKNSAYAPCYQWQPPCPPIDGCTTYNYYYTPHAVEPRRNYKPSEEYQPCCCPFEECTTTRADFPRKEPIPNGPANSEVLKHGLWSCEQFRKEFTGDTTTKAEFGPKCACKRGGFYPEDNLCIPCYPLKTDTETASQFYCKSEQAEPTHCFHPWLDHGRWHKPETPMDKCTTYKFYYKRHPPRTAPTNKSTVESPDAIPFCSMNRLCYSCYDPTPNQKTPVEMKDNDPWPYVKPCQIRYQDNLTTDPCATFKGETTQKADYTPKALCRPNPNFAPLKGFIPPNTPFNDDTTMKVAFRKYSQDEYRNAKGYAGNCCPIKYGPNFCKEKTNKCLPRFPAPYGNPLKPFNCQNCKCPCGPFDDRSTYNQDFRFRSKEEVDLENEERCRKINVPQGVSLYRFDYVRQYGKKAARMPPPTATGHRCMHPCDLQDLDTLYRLSYRDFWQNIDRNTLELYRGHPVIKTRRNDGAEDCAPKNTCCGEDDPLGPDDECPIIYQPILIKKPKKKPCPCPKPMPLINNIWVKSEEDQTSNGDGCRAGDGQPERFFKGIPYSGADILNRAKSTFVCDGHNPQ